MHLCVIDKSVMLCMHQCVKQQFHTTVLYLREALYLGKVAMNNFNIIYTQFLVSVNISPCSLVNVKVCEATGTMFVRSSESK